jgi:hypothetical protein
MRLTDKRFTEAENDLLRRAKGKRLLSIDAAIVAPPDRGWETVRLHFDGLDLDVNDFLGDVVIDENGTVEEFGLMSVCESTAEPLDLPGVGSGTTVFDVGETVASVMVANDCIDTYENGSLVTTFLYPQAVVFRTDRGFVVLDKGVWFSDMIAVKRGSTLDGLIYDESKNWEDDPDEDPTTHYEFRLESYEL